MLGSNLFMTSALSRVEHTILKDKITNSSSGLFAYKKGTFVQKNNIFHVRFRGVLNLSYEHIMNIILVAYEVFINNLILYSC